MGTGTEPLQSRKLRSPPERNGSARQTSQKLQSCVRQAHRADPDVVEPARVDAEAATDQIDIAVGPVDEPAQLVRLGEDPLECSCHGWTSWSR